MSNTSAYKSKFISTTIIGKEALGAITMVGLKTTNDGTITLDTNLSDRSVQDIVGQPYLNARLSGHNPRPGAPPNDEIWYTSSDGNIVNPTEIAFGDGITIVDNTYEDGKGVIKLSGDCTEVGYHAFWWDALTLSSIILPDSVTSIGEEAFNYCTNLTLVDMPDSITTIDYRAFADCSALTSFTIPGGVTSISEELFISCTSLESVTLPDGITTIDNNAFTRCRKLSSITLPDSVTTIIGTPFHECDSMTSFICLPVVPPVCEVDIFDEYPQNCYIYVPADSVDAYKVDPIWSKYAGRIQAIQE